MRLNGKVALIYGAGGAIGGAVARAFAHEGATVYLAGRTVATLEVVAHEIAVNGGRYRVAPVDAFDEGAVARLADAVAAESGTIDIALNAIGVPHVQGVPLRDLSLEDYERPIHAYLRTHFLTVRAAARHMTPKRSGVIMALSTPAARLAFPGVLGFGTTCAAIEGLCRHLAAELGAEGVRVVCLRPDALPEALVRGSHSRAVFGAAAARAGATVEQLLAGRADASLLKRSPTLAEVASAAVFVASDEGGAMTGAVLNLGCGSVVD